MQKGNGVSYTVTKIPAHTGPLDVRKTFPPFLLRIRERGEVHTVRETEKKQNEPAAATTRQFHWLPYGGGV